MMTKNIEKQNTKVLLIFSVLSNTKKESNSAIAKSIIRSDSPYTSITRPPPKRYKSNTNMRTKKLIRTLLISVGLVMIIY